MSNPYKSLKALVPDLPLDVGEVQSVGSNGSVVSLLTGGTIRAYGEATIGDTVYLRGDEIIGPAPSLAASEVLLF